MESALDWTEAVAFDRYFQKTFEDIFVSWSL